MVSPFQFVASTTNILPIYDLISAISPFGSSCYLNITAEGLCFSIVCNNICKVVLTLDRKLFTSYQMRQEDKRDGSNSDTDTESDSEDEGPASLTLSINLKSFLETINIHIPADKDSLEINTKCTLSYQKQGAPFVLTFEDDFIIERCELLTYYVDSDTVEAFKVNGDANSDEPPSAAFQLDKSTVIFEAVLKSSILYDALKDMADLHTDEFVLYCSKDYKEGNAAAASQKRLIFISRSQDSSIGYSKLVIPQKQPYLKTIEVFRPVTEEDGGETEMVRCSASVSSFYRFEHFARLIRAIKLSKLIKVRKDMSGLTSFLVLIGPEGFRKLKESDSRVFYGTSIEFTTLESVPLEERILAEEMPESAHTSPIALKFGYNNMAIERMIKDEESIKVIRITGDGQLTTIDDYFQPESQTMEPDPEPLEVGDSGDQSAVHSKPPSKAPSKRTRVPLEVTEELTRSLLGQGTGPHRPSRATAGTDVHAHKKRKAKGKGIETVGGAIEIPLFI